MYLGHDWEAGVVTWPQESAVTATLSFVDLAGSERVGRTGNTGHRLKCAPLYHVVNERLDQ